MCKPHLHYMGCTVSRSWTRRVLAIFHVKNVCCLQIAFGPVDTGLLEQELSGAQVEAQGSIRIDLDGCIAGKFLCGQWDIRDPHGSHHNGVGTAGKEARSWQ